MVGNLLKAIRPLNLLIVALLQYLLYYQVLIPTLDDPRLTAVTFAGFVLSGVLLTASGYLINDYYDYAGDQINKKDWHSLTQSQLLTATVITVSIGALLSLWVAYSIHALLYVSIYLLAAVLLYSYSAWGKRQPLIGNLMVAAFCGLSITVLLLAEWPALSLALETTPSPSTHVVNLILGLSIFAFMITLVREMVKDVQDIHGDRAQGYNTLPIKSGIPRTKLMILWYIGLTLILAISWAFSQWNNQSLIANLYFAISVIGSLAYLLYRSTHLHGNETYGQVSTLCKYVIVLGMGYVVLV